MAYGKFGGRRYGKFTLGLNTELNDLRKLICLRKSEVSFENISLCNVAIKLG